MENDQNLVSSNWAQAWLRVVMWILPTGFFWISAFGANYLTAYSGVIGDLSTYLWVLLNIGFMIGAGWYDSLLSSRARKSPGSSYLWIIQFFLHQLYLIPLITFVVAMAVCAVAR